MSLFEDIMDMVAGMTNTFGKPIIMIAEKWWWVLLLIPLVPLLWVILHYGFNIL